MTVELRSLGTLFAIEGSFVAATPHGSGHIHDTFVAEYRSSGNSQRFIHQRLNTRVFHDLDAVCSNVERITGHLTRKLVERGVPDPERRCLRPVRARDGRSFATDATGAAWRTFHFIERTRTRDTVENPEQARRVARTFGCFTADLIDLPGPPLVVTIPHFHDLAFRITQLRDATATDPHGRRTHVEREVGLAHRLHDQIQTALASSRVAALPRRTVHNDCKLNNVLLDATSGEPLCVIDLDTVMGGTVDCDFGELVRSSTCRAPEDERDLAAIDFDLDLFAALADGYLQGSATFLTPAERGILPLAGPLLAFENAIRFLADHLYGDLYFRIRRSGHNLDRARAQLTLASRMLERTDDARHIIEVAR